MVDPLHPASAQATTRSETPVSRSDPYQSGMTPDFSRLHGHVLAPLLRQITLTGTPLETLRELAQEATLVYVTPEIGQFEYHVLNWLLHEDDLPLAHYGHGLRTSWWVPWTAVRRRIIAHVRRWHARDPLPHPVRSGHLGTLLHRGDSILVRLKTSRLFDDRLWEEVSEDPLGAIIAAHAQATRPIVIIPIQYLWDRRPAQSHKSLIDLLFGERLHPGRIRKAVLFCRNYRSRSVVQIGKPIALGDLQAAYPRATTSERTDTLREVVLQGFHRERKGTAGPMLKPRPWMIEQTLNDPATQRLLYTLSQEKDSSIADLQHLARRYAHEIAADVNYRYVEVVTRVIAWIFRNIYDGIEFAEADLTRIRDAVARGPMALVPNHRSHIDYLLLSTLLYRHNVALPFVAAGLNMAFWPFGFFARRCGAFFLRRTFGGNRLYRAVFSAYLSLLIREGGCIEFFIEGGRSRTGKSLMPRMGMLTMLSEAMDCGAAEDFTFLPISLTYDRVIEQGAYLDEISGGQKPRESWIDLLRIGKFLRHRYGRIYLRVGNPITYRDAVEQVSHESPEIDTSPADDRPRVARHLAATVMRELNRGIIVTPAALTATSLLLARRGTITMEALESSAQHLLTYLRWRQAPATELVCHKLPVALDEAARLFVQQHYIHRHAKFDPTYFTIVPENRASLDLRKSTIIHYFTALSVLATILQTRTQRGAQQIALAHIDHDFSLCQDLFRVEFRFAARATRAQHMARHLSFLAEQGLIDQDQVAGTVTVSPNAAEHLDLYRRLLRPYFECYYALLTCAEAMPAVGRPSRELIEEARAYATHLLHLDRLQCLEGISQLTFRNAVMAFEQLTVLTPQSSCVAWNSTPLGLKLKAALQQWCDIDPIV